MATTTFNDLITFSRGSNATVTGPNGLIQWAPANLLTNSQDFEAAAWTKNNTTASANTAVAPDGTITADRVTPNTTNAAHNIYGSYTLVAGAHTLSIFAKAAGYSWIKLGSMFSGNGVFFDVSTGTVGNANAGYTGAITDAGNGWYRCTVAWVAAAGADLPGLYVASSGSTVSFAGDGTSSILVWGAQLELGSTATTYNNTSVRNLLGFSEAFDNAAWTKTRASMVTGAQANPVNGLFNAQKLMEDTTASNTHFCRQTFAVPANPITFSVYVKVSGRTNVRLVNASYGNAAYFTLTGSGSVGTTDSATGSISLIGDGWYRCSMTFTQSVAASVSFDVRLASGSTGGSDTYTGDGNSGVYIYGAMLSNSASLDPYVPTPGAAPSSTAYYGPRFDYDPVTLLPRGLLVEEARTNLTLYSEQFDNAAWTKLNATVFPNQNPAATSGAERRATGVTAMLGTSTPATYNTSTGVGTATRTDPSNSSGVTFTVPNASSLYAVDISNTGATTMQIRINALNGTVVATILPGVGGVFPVSGMSAGTPIIALTSSTDGTTASFTVNSVRELIGGFIISPDGTANADKLVEDATASVGHLISQGPTLTAVAHTYSVYAKASERNWICLLNNSIANALAFFNLATGTIGTVGSGATATITNVGNGWYRCSITFTAIAATNNCHIRLAPSDNVLSYNGVAGNGAFIYGAQLEAGAFATSYIPTIASTVTRSADVATITGSLFSQWYNQSEGAFIIDSSMLALNTVITQELVALDDSGVANNIFVRANNTAGSTSATATTASVSQGFLDIAGTTAGTPQKVGYGIKLNDAALVRNGGTVVVDTTYAVPTGLNRMAIGARLTASAYLNGHIRSIRYVPVRAADFQLQQVTT